MGKLYGIGVGPGDPELVTLKAQRILLEADVIFCPEKEEGSGSIAFHIIKGLLQNSKAEIVNLVYPMHYHGMCLQKIWRENALRIAKRLEGNCSGAFITLGDPTVYSTFMYALPYIEAEGVAVEVVPGVPSFCAVAASRKMPLASWNENLMVVPVRKNSSEELGKILREHDNIVLMKPSANKQAFIQAMRENHLEDRFVLVTKSGTEEEQQIVDLKQLEEYDIPYLSTIIVKKQEKPKAGDCL